MKLLEAAGPPAKITFGAGFESAESRWRAGIHADPAERAIILITALQGSRTAGKVESPAAPARYF